MMIIKTVIAVIAYLVAAPLVGGLLTGADRKISARMQGRKGPSIRQPFYDVLKLFEKEQQTVSNAQDFFVLLSMFITIAAGMLFFGGGNLLLIIFMLAGSTGAMVLAGAASGSVYSGIGSQREMVQMMAYGPLLIMIAAGFYLCNGSFLVRDIMLDGTIVFPYLIGLFIGLVLVIAVKLRKSPFDISMSYGGYQDMMNGVATEFSGKTMAAVEICRWYETVLLLGFVFLFFADGNVLGTVIGVVVCIIVYLFEILVDNSFARVKTQNMLQVLWAAALILGVVNLFAIYLIV